MKSEIRCTLEIREDDTRTSSRQARRNPTHVWGEGDRPGRAFRGWRAHMACRWNRDQSPASTRGSHHARRAELRGRELVIDQPLPDTMAGRDAAAEIRSGLFRGLSVEFQAKRQSIVWGVRRIREAVLGAAGLVDDPSYSGSTVELRDKSDHYHVDLRPWG